LEGGRRNSDASGSYNDRANAQHKQHQCISNQRRG